MDKHLIQRHGAILWWVNQLVMITWSIVLKEFDNILEYLNWTMTLWYITNLFATFRETNWLKSLEHRQNAETKGSAPMLLELTGVARLYTKNCGYMKLYVYINLHCCFSPNLSVPNMISFANKFQEKYQHDPLIKAIVITSQAHPNHNHRCIITQFPTSWPSHWLWHPEVSLHRNASMGNDWSLDACDTSMFWSSTTWTVDLIRGKTVRFQ